MKTYPLTQSQLGLFIECMQHPESTRYNLPFMLSIPKSIDLDRLEKAIRTIYDERPELRIRMLLEDGNPRQIVDEPGNLTIKRFTMSEEECEEYIKNYVQPFDIFTETLCRFSIIETPQRNVVLSQIHHLVSDGLTLAMNLSKVDFPRAYNGEPLEPVPYGMLQWAEDEEATFSTPEYERAKEYYAKEYSGYHMISLADNHEHPMGETLCCSEFIPMPLLDDWSKEQGTQSNLVLIAAFSHVVATLSREEKIAFTSLFHGRSDKRLRKAYGMFVRTVPVKADVNPQQKVIDFIKSFRAEMMSMIRYSVYPFSHFCKDLQMLPGIDFSFQTGNITEVFDFGDEQYPIVHLPKGSTTSDMTVVIYETEGQYEIRVEASDALYSKEYLQMIARGIKNTVLCMMQHAEDQLSVVNMLSTEEQQELVTLGTGKYIDRGTDMTWVKAFERKVAENPDALAVADKDSTLTYGELNHNSDVLAHKLIEAGVVPDEFICVMLKRVKEFPMTILAIHKAGAAYTPLDIDYPIERLGYMIENSQSKVLITTREVLTEKQKQGTLPLENLKMIYLEDIDFSISCDPVNVATPKNLAYMIYTSGSTGKPKGVMLHQAGLWNFTLHTIESNELTENDRISCHRSFSFDAHIEDVFPVLSAGASIHIMPSEIRKDLNEIYQFLTDHKITGGGYTTSIAKMLLMSFDLKQRYISCGGEALSGVISDKVQIINEYGPTECTDHSNVFKLEKGKQYKVIPIGPPVPNTYNFIVDKQNHLLPRGVEGELCIAGIQVGRGYWQLPEQTEKVFGICPFLGNDEDGQPVRMYHTGDICRWNDQGCIEYVGRADSQVKLRGYRIEMAEVEDGLLRFPDIKRAAATIKTLGGTPHLCAYYISERKIDGGEVRNFLAQILNSYMVPDAYMQLDELPRTPSGKVDYRNLPDPDVVQTLENVPPETEKERKLLDIARNLLQRDDFGITDDLFLLGLTSMTAMKMAVMAAKEGILLKVYDVLKNGTIQKILSQHMGLGFWYNGYSKKKPILIVLQGINEPEVMMQKMKEWQELFSIFYFEPTYEHDKYIFSDADAEEMLKMYYEYMCLFMPEDADIFGFIGLSWAGEQAYRLACRWHEEKGTYPIVYLGDTRIMSDTGLYSEEEIHRYSSYLKETNPQLVNVPIEELERPIREKAEMINRLRVREFPRYDGRVELFVATKYHDDMEADIAKWKNLADNIDITYIDDHHANLVNLPEYIHIYTDKMKENLQEAERINHIS